MKETFNEKLMKSRSLYERTLKTRQLLILSFRQWLNYRLNSDITALRVAAKNVQSAIKPGNMDLSLHFAQVFFMIEQREYDRAHEQLEKAAAYKNFFKANEQLSYGIYLFLEALLDLRIGKHRAADKHFKILADYAANQNHHMFSLMLGMIKMENEEYQAAFSYLTEAFSKGSRSSFLFESVYRFLQTGEPIKGNPKLFLAFINWSISQGLDINAIITHYKDTVMVASIDNAGALLKIYNDYPEETILKSICRNFIRESDYSGEAYKYYKEAEAKQLDIPILQQTLVRAAFYANTEELGRYTMEQFLHSGGMDSDIKLKAYVYHLVLTSKKMREFVSELESEMIQFALYSLENELRGRHYNSIYKFLVCHENVSEIPVHYIKKAVEYLKYDIFRYHIAVENKDVKHIWLIEKEKKELEVYEIVNGEAVVLATSEFFSYVCFSEGVKTIQDSKIKITKLVENADTQLYERFYLSGIVTDEILISLARNAISLQTLTPVAIEILKTTGANKSISVSFKTQVYAKLGNYFFADDDLPSASRYYKDIDDRYLNDKYIESMLVVLISTGDFQRASLLIAKKSYCMEDRVLFLAVKEIVKSKQNNLFPIIAAAAYELLLKSWYDKRLIDVVIKYFKGCQLEWEELGKSLNLMSVDEPALDLLILTNSIWIKKPTKVAQEVFCRVYRHDMENEIIPDYMSYLVYEMLTNNFKTEYETTTALEKYFLRTDDSFLAYGLSHMYLTHGMTTLHSDRIIETTLGFMEQDGFMLPMFKNIQDKKLRTSYIEKNQPFIYKSLPDKNVCVYFKLDSETEFRSQKMKYFRFGMYYAVVPHFYGEKMLYYFSEEMPTGSITTKEVSIENNQMFLSENENNTEPFFVLNNALIYEQMFKYDKVEAIITETLRDLHRVFGKLL